MLLYLILLTVVPIAAFLWAITRGPLSKTGWEAPVVIGNIVLFLALGAVLFYAGRFVKTDLLAWPTMFAICSWTVSAVLSVFVIMEYVIIRLISLLRIGAIVRVTYYEALLQPFTLVVLVGAIIALVFFGLMPFFTISEDAKMYRDVATSFVLLFPLILMVFAAGKVVDEEIENRTMLTLMSKPISRWQVIVGKYLGVVALVFVSVAALGIVAGATSYIRYYDDMRIDIQVAGIGKQFLYFDNFKAVMAFMPITVLTFLQLSTLAAISVAVSTRYGLVVNLTLIAIIYVGANMTRFIPDLDIRAPWKGIAQTASYVLPYLANFDLNQRLVYGSYRWDTLDPIGGASSGIPTYTQVWEYVGVAFVYALCYIGAALSFATALFRTRELT